MPAVRLSAIGVSLVFAFALVACGSRGCHTSVSKGWDASYSVSFGGAASDASILPAAIDASTAEAGPEDAAIDSSLPPGMRGVFHLDVGPDERNLSIDPNGTFFWRIFGCDFSGGACGVWAIDGTSLVLTPAYGAKTMGWDDGVTFSRDVTKVVLHDKGTYLEARVFAADGAKLVQLWYPGRICAPCGGGEGPSGKLYPCAKPLVRSCR
jgi:hypothetical protein